MGSTIIQNYFIDTTIITTTTTTTTTTSTSIIDIEERKITRIEPQHIQPNRTATMFTLHSVFIALALLCLIVQSSSTTTATELDENGIVPESLMLLEEENTRLLDGGEYCLVCCDVKIDYVCYL